MISVVELAATDILVCSVPVGNMPPIRAAEYLETVKLKLTELLGSEQKLLMLPVRGYDAAPEMTIIKRIV